MLTFDLIAAEFGHEQAKRVFLGIAKADRPTYTISIWSGPKNVPLAAPSTVPPTSEN